MFEIFFYDKRVQKEIDGFPVSIKVRCYKLITRLAE